MTTAAAAAATGATPAAGTTQAAASTAATTTATQTPAAQATTQPTTTGSTVPAAATNTEDAGILGTAAEEAATPAAEAAIEVKVPEGFKADEAVMGEFGKIAKSLGLKSEGAQKLVDLFASTTMASAKAANEAFAKQQISWRDAVKSDKEIGGQNYDQTIVDVKRAFGALDKDGSIRKEIAALGLGNHPALVRLAVRASRLMKEDGVGAGTTPGSGERSEAEMLAIRYPSMFPKQ